MNQIDRSFSTTTSEKPLRFAFVQSLWHRDIVDQAREGFKAEIARRGLPASAVDYFEVPGAFELPLHAKVLAETGLYAGIVCAGFVVDGGIYRHDFVADAVVSGFMRVQLDTGVPVFSVVLTPHHFHEHEEHRAYFTRHFVIKGGEAAHACLETAAALAKVKAIVPA